MGLRKEFEDDLDEVNRIDGNSLELRNTLYLNYIARALLTIADTFTGENENETENHLNYEQFCKLKEEVIGETPVYYATYIAAIFIKYESLIFEGETDD